MGGTGRTLLSLSLSSNFLSFSLLRPHRSLSKFPRPASVFLGFKPLCTATSSATGATIETSSPVQPLKHSLLLHKLRSRHLKDVSKTTERVAQNNNSKKTIVESFVELGLSEEVMMAVRELNISVPTEIQCLGIPSILEGNSVALGSHTGSGKTLAYLLPVVQLLRRDEAISGVLTKPRRPRAVVLCPTRELSEQVYHVAKSISHHARFRSTMVSGGGRSRPQEDSLNAPVDMVVGTPGRVLQHIEDRNIVYGDIKYLVLDEADTMFDHGFGPEIQKFLSPLKNRASKSNDPGFQTVLVAATMTKAVQKLIDEEFQGITHLRTSTVHKKIASARHDFIKLSGSENKLEVLLQVLEPSLAKGNKVMVFCNTLNSSRAVDHFLAENQVSTVNYHGEVPAEQRAENFEKFKSDDGDCPTLVCTDLAARGLDLAVDHVIMFDFPSSSIDYLHRSGRTARMGAKGKVTSLIAKRDFILASRIEEALRKNESLEAITVDRKVGSDDGAAMPRTAGRQKRKKFDSAKPADHRKKSLKPLRILDQKKGKKLDSAKSADRQKKSVKPPSFTGKVEYQQSKAQGGKSAEATAAAKSTRRTIQASGRSISKGGVSSAGKKLGQTNAGLKPTSSKLSVVGFRGRSSSSRKEESRPC